MLGFHNPNMMSKEGCFQEVDVVEHLHSIRFPLTNCTMCVLALFLFLFTSCGQSTSPFQFDNYLLWYWKSVPKFRPHIATNGCIHHTHCKKACYFDNFICHQNCNCWLEIVPAMAIQQAHMEYRSSWSCYKVWEVCLGIRWVLYTRKDPCHVNCSTHTHLF